MDATTLIIWLAIGAIAGFLADLLVGGLRGGLLGAIVVGILGAFIGGWLLNALEISIGLTGIAADIVIATIGAIVLLTILKLIR